MPSTVTNRYAAKADITAVRAGVGDGRAAVESLSASSPVPRPVPSPAKNGEKKEKKLRSHYPKQPITASLSLEN